MVTLSVQVPFEYQRLNRSCQAHTQNDIFNIMENLKYQMRSDTTLTPVGLLVFNHASDVSYSKECTFYYLGESPHYSVSYLKVENPLKTHDGALRYRGSAISTETTPSTLSQLYAMLDLYRGDEIVTKNTAKIRDVYAKDLYAWESSVYESKSILGVMEMERLIRNLLAYAGIPYITINFVEDANSCSFSFKTKFSGKQKTDDTPEGLPSHDWLNQSDEELFDNITQDGNRQSKVELNDLALTFPISWGLCREIAIHEISHYTVFLLPLKHKVNRGPLPMSFAEYSVVFAGHGALYCAVFLFLLHKFNVFDRESLYFNFSKTKIPFFIIESLDPLHIDEQIAAFITQKRTKKPHEEKHLLEIGDTE